MLMKKAIKQTKAVNFSKHSSNDFELTENLFNEPTIHCRISFGNLWRLQCLT